MSMKKIKKKMFNFRAEEKLINAFKEEALRRGLKTSSLLRNIIIRELANPTLNPYEQEEELYEEDTKDL